MPHRLGLGFGLWTVWYKMIFQKFQRLFIRFEFLQYFPVSVKLYIIQIYNGGAFALQFEVTYSLHGAPGTMTEGTFAGKTH